MFKNPLGQTLEERVEKQLICWSLLGLLQVRPLWMACSAHVTFMMTGKWDTPYHHMQSHSNHFRILTPASFLCWPCRGLFNVSHFLGVSQFHKCSRQSVKTKTTPKYCRHSTLQRSLILPRLYCVSRSPLHCGGRWRNRDHRSEETRC